jgi:hypothetical protein
MSRIHLEPAVIREMCAQCRRCKHAKVVSASGGAVQLLRGKQSDACGGAVRDNGGASLGTCG